MIFPLVLSLLKDTPTLTFLHREGRGKPILPVKTEIHRPNLWIPARGPE